MIEVCLTNVSVQCPRCYSYKVYRHGHSSSQHERFRCRICGRVFQMSYTYEARKPGVKEQIVDMSINGAGVRDTARKLKVATNTVMQTLKKSHESR
ncbi:hypothetical protein EGO56_20775 (plasmid) [Pantoea vagans]|nr:hypothetical protein EGO56_20775 [Pantoea vagans]